MEIKDTVVMITGGASGLGESTADYLAQLGAKIVVLDINKQDVLRVASLTKGLGVVCDVTSRASVTQALQQAKERFGVPRVCINCAGILGGERTVGRDGPMDLEHFRKIIDIDLIGTFNVMSLALAEMIPLEPMGQTAERGVVINVASIAAYDGQIGQAAYSAAKGGVASMTLPVAREMGKFGIRIVCIAPGVFDTPMMEKASEPIRAGLLENAVFPHRFGKPEEFAKFVVTAISNPMLNGDVIRLDGAMRMPPR